MQRECLNDAGFVIQNILNQPLFIIGTKGEVTLLTAAEQFEEQQTHDSNLGKVLFSFLEYPGATEVMTRELELIVQELTEEFSDDGYEEEE